MVMEEFRIPVTCRALAPDGGREDAEHGTGEANQPRQPALSTRKHLIDVKTIYRGGTYYQGGRLTNSMQAGAVMQRGVQVNPEYVRHAQGLDRELSPQGMTPIEDRLRHFGDVRAAVFGAYGEASRDVHLLLSASTGRWWSTVGRVGGTTQGS